MCGFIRRDISQTALRECLAEVGWANLFEAGNQAQAQGRALVADERLLDGTRKGLSAARMQFYPAFGGVADRQIKGLICASTVTPLEAKEGFTWAPQVVDATWWFDCQPEGDTLRLGKRTTFNARNLSSPFWRSAVAGHRALVLANEVGETQTINGRKTHYLMRSEKPFFLGALYRRYANGRYSCAVITKAPTAEFARYHEKAAPLILPQSPELLRRWINPQINASTDPVFQKLLHEPSLPIGLSVTPVKTFKSGEPIGETVWLTPDN